MVYVHGIIDAVCKIDLGVVYLLAKVVLVLGLLFHLVDNRPDLKDVDLVAEQHAAGTSR